MIRPVISTRREAKAAKLAIGLWVTWLIIGLAFWATVGYVVFHFISKAW